MYFDSHAHYYDSKLLEETKGESVDSLIDALLLDGDVSYIVNVGTNTKNSLVAIEQASKHKNMYAAVGIHPSDCKEESDFSSSLDRIRSLAVNHSDTVVAIGEIGLDYYWEPIDKEMQKAYFEAQLELARELSLPVIIHDREAHGDCFDIVMSHKDVKGVFHSYSGSVEMARELIKNGWMISFSGTLTFKNAKRVVEVASALPKDKVLVETDCPYLTPHPHRGKINHSGYLKYTNDALSEIWGIESNECARITCENAKRFFGINT
jgi:TatD DNase family protein